MISNAHRQQNGGHDPPKMLGDVQNLRIPGYTQNGETELSRLGSNQPKMQAYPKRIQMV